MKAAFQNETRPATNDREPNREFAAPEVNIFETKDGYVLEAEMPGVRKDGLEITLEGNEITSVAIAIRNRSAGNPCSANVGIRITAGFSDSIRPLIPQSSRPG